MKKRLFSKFDYWLVAIFFVLSSCSNHQSVKNINSDEFKRLIERSNAPLVLDVRTDM